MATVLHILEEYALDFVGWIHSALSINVSWEQFHIVNIAVVLFAVCGAMIGWQLPEVSLIAPALVIINAIFFHIGCSVVLWRYSPGAISSALLFIPVGIWAYYGAYRDGVLTRRALLLSLLGGALWHVYLLLLFPIKDYLLKG
jgi:hypothetical protein